MGILREPKIWRRTDIVRTKRVRIGSELTDEEQAAVRRALVFLRARIGSSEKLAGALGVGLDALRRRAFWKHGKPGAALALRAARLAGVPLEGVLSGAWPPEGACPHCGRS